MKHWVLLPIAVVGFVLLTADTCNVRWWLPGGVELYPRGNDHRSEREADEG